MGFLLILAQVVLMALDLAAHVITLNLWLVFLPGILFFVTWTFTTLMGCVFAIDRLNPFGPRLRSQPPRRRR